MSWSKVLHYQKCDCYLFNQTSYMTAYIQGIKCSRMFVIVMSWEEFLLKIERNLVAGDCTLLESALISISKLIVVLYGAPFMSSILSGIYCQLMILISRWCCFFCSRRLKYNHQQFVFLSASFIRSWINNNAVAHFQYVMVFTVGCWLPLSYWWEWLAEVNALNSIQ